MTATAALLALLVSVLAAVAALRWRTARLQDARRSKAPALRSLCAVMGSGGHTTEMLRLLAGLGPKPFRPRLYVLAESDTTSEPRIHELERQLGSSSSSSTDYRITRIPRSREVGQSWISTVITTLQAATSSLALLCTDPPDMARLLCNGPGTCVPIAVLARALQLAGIVSTRIVYVESFARVNSLSLSGKILYRIADCFVVQWPQLAARYPKAVFRGRLV